jgi:hypothetical protein
MSRTASITRQKTPGMRKSSRKCASRVLKLQSAQVFHVVPQAIQRAALVQQPLVQQPLAPQPLQPEVLAL